MSNDFKIGDKVLVETTISDVYYESYAVYSAPFVDSVWIDADAIRPLEMTDAQTLRRAAKICQENFGSVILTTNQMLHLADTFDPPEFDVFEVMKEAYESLKSVADLENSPTTKKLFLALKRMEKGANP